MAVAVSLDSIDPALVKINKGGGNRPSSSVFPFFLVTEGERTLPSVFLVRYEKGTKSSAHFHTVAQFNIVVEGKGLFGRHVLTPYHVHFSHAYTPYGPLLPDKDQGWAFLTVRTRYDPGAQRLPEAQKKLQQIPGRRPWQVTRKVEFASDGGRASMQPIADIADDQGLSACALSLPGGSSITAPDPARGDGQYVIVLEGSVLHHGAEHSALAVVSIPPGEPAFEVRAGAHGLKGLVLNFPRVGSADAGSTPPERSAGLKKWQCALCAFEYDEALGMPEDGVAAGTRWEDVPESWTCPDCGASKTDFEMVVV